MEVRNGLYRKYKKALTTAQAIDGVCICIGVASTAISTGFLATGAGAVVALPIQAVGLFTGAFGFVGRFAERRIMAKLRKHDQIRILAQSKLNTIATKVSQAYEDGCISHEEFESINNEKTKYMLMKNKIRFKTQEAMAKGLSNSEETSIFGVVKTDKSS